MEDHTGNLALQLVSASPRPKIVREPGPGLWVADRTGHTSGETMARYRRGARTAAELELGWLAPLTSAIPELSGDRSCLQAVPAGGLAVSGQGEKPAEREGFEPSVPLQVHMISNPGGAPTGQEIQQGDDGRPPSQSTRGQSGDSPLSPLSALLDALDTADRLARDLGLPQVRVRIAAARQAAHLRRVS